MLVKILFVFTHCFKLQYIVKNRIHFNTARGRLLTGNIYLFTGRLAYNWGAGEGGGGSYKRGALINGGLLYEPNCLFRSSPPEPLITPGQICGGNYIWKIDGFRSLLFQYAGNGIVTSLESPSIYTSLHGYKFFMRVFPNGIDGGDGRHIGLFVGITQGEYDTLLEWPFCGRISLTIKDQSTDVHGFRQDISGTFMANRHQGAFQKPTAAGRYKTLYGYAEFAPITMVCASQYSKDDTVMIQIEIHNIP